MSRRRPESPRPVRTLRVAAAACLAFALLYLGAPVAARAQDPQPPVILPPDTLSIDDAVRMALSRNYDVTIASNQAREARGRALSSYSGILPQVDAFAGYSHESITGPRFVEDVNVFRGTSESDGQSIDVTLSQSFFNWSTFQNIKGARAGARAFEELAEAERLDTALATRIQYYELYKAIQLRNVRDEGVDLAEDQLERAETLFELGSVARNDVLQARVNLQQARLDQITATNQVEVQRARLAQILGVSLASPLEIASAIPPGAVAGEIDSLAVYREALAERPDLVAARETVSSAEAQVGSAWGAYLPELFGRLNYFSNLRNGDDRFVVDGNEVVLDNDSDGWSAQAGVRISVFDGLLREGQVRSAKGSLAAERTRLQQSEHAVQVEVKEAMLGVREASQSITAAQEGVALAEENLKLAQERYQVGSGTILELDEAQVSLIESRSALVDAEAALRVAEARLERARGAGLPAGA
jgi:outer membrane protein TolC